MRVSRRGAGLLALATLLLPVEAHANELLVMPYSCSMVGGQPLLSPGPEQGHRIAGSRDQRRFSACSPVNPDMCREWTVHRFDLDCDGTRVPWVSVVAATNEGSRRAWLLNGRLVLRMGPRWSLPADDPCALDTDPDRRFEYRRMRRSCADRLALAPPPVVEMPFGYAPMLGINGIFVKAGPNVAGRPSPLPPVAAAPPGALGAPGTRPSPHNPMPDLFPEPQRAWPQAERDPFADEPAAPAVPPQTVPQPQPAPKVAAAAPPIPSPTADAPKVAPVESKPAVPPAAPQVNLGPRIVANPPAPPAVAVGEAPKTAAVPAKPGAAEASKIAAASPPPKAAEPPPRKAADAPAALRGPAAEPESDGSGVSLLSVFRTTTVGALVAFGGLALGLLAAFALARRNEHVRDSRVRPRDLTSVSLGDRRAKPPARIANARGNLPPNAAASAMSRVPGQAAAAASAAAELGDRMPETRSEALQVLGIGMAPTANEAAIKKVVDGLRQSWHPDLAKDEADRTLRELRSKQINSAWELLRNQRAVV